MRRPTLTIGFPQKQSGNTQQEVEAKNKSGLVLIMKVNSENMRGMRIILAEKHILLAKRSQMDLVFMI